MVDIYPERISPHTLYTIEVRYKDFCQSVRLAVSRYEGTLTTAEEPLKATTGLSPHSFKLYLGAATYKQQGVTACVHGVVLFGRAITSLTVHERHRSERIDVEG